MSLHGLIAHFLALNKYYVVCMYHSLYNYLPTEGHLICIQVLAIMNKAAIYICIQVFVWT